MNVRLLYSDKSFHFEDSLPNLADQLCTDLKLNQIFSVMSDGDERVLKAVQAVILCPLQNRDEILRRQDILKDCIQYPQTVFSLYRLTSEALDRKSKEGWWLFSSSASNCFYGSVKMLQLYHSYLIRLRKIADNSLPKAHSQGFQQLFRDIQHELDDSFLKKSKTLLDELNFRDGTMIEMRLGTDNRIANYALVREKSKKERLRWMMAPSYTLASRDDAGARDLSSRCDRACYESVDMLIKAVAHVEEYFNTLCNEIAFYVGAIHLQDIMKNRGIAYCFPQIKTGAASRCFYNLRDLNLALQIDHCVGNDLHTKGKLLYLITGANQGGKTTFLRSIGQAQVMLQSGLFVAAEKAECHLCNGIFTHFKREEDDSMKSGKLDEELQRLDQLVPMLKTGSLILFNESFSSTNEREGSEICRQITEAFREKGIEQFHVSHLFQFAHECFMRKLPEAYFLRAERLTDGERSYKMIEAEPIQTAYGADLYHKLMEKEVI